ncbi:MAG: haloacid dehalogenase type II [Chloroflexi bacterium]|nr:haloacid dehalogenase type II [Chloroflexota bacterium]
MVQLDGVTALTFDVFGTVVDWRGSIIREGRRLSRERGLRVDWPAFADAWRAGYAPAMDRVRRGDLPWQTLDRLHRLILDSLIEPYGLGSLTEAERVDLNHVWRRLRPWPDAVRGLRRLKRRYTIATLSNGNVALLTAMAKYSGLPWDCILSAELARHYKPDPEIYQTAAALLDLAPPQVLMVAAHPGDLRAAGRAGFRTAYVARPREFGPARAAEPVDPAAFDVTATDFLDLATRLGA